jgi:hypothetical protein
MVPIDTLPTTTNASPTLSRAAGRAEPTGLHRHSERRRAHRWRRRARRALRCRSGETGAADGDRTVKNPPTRTSLPPEPTLSWRNWLSWRNRSMHRRLMATRCAQWRRRTWPSSYRTLPLMLRVTSSATLPPGAPTIGEPRNAPARRVVEMWPPTRSP